MPYVEISFRVESDDPAHSTGLTNDRYKEIMDAVMEIGGEDLETRKMENDE